MALFLNNVASVALRVWFCSGTDGNIRCRKGRSMYPRPTRSRLHEATLHSAPLRVTLLPLLISALDARTPRSARQRARPLRGRRLVGPPSMPHYHAAGGGRRSIRANARSSGGQGYVQHYSTVGYLNMIFCGPEEKF